jgi:preprotein translocase SecE subunit
VIRVAWRIYKEGQGKWLRGSMAALIFLGAVIGVRNLHLLLGRLTAKTTFVIPGINWQLDWRFLVDAPVLILVLVWAVVLYNKPKLVEFLIETENELKNRVTWPTKKEEINASVVVVITVVIMMMFIFGIDQVFTILKKVVFH